MTGEVAHCYQNNRKRHHALLLPHETCISETCISESETLERVKKVLLQLSIDAPSLSIELSDCQGDIWIARR